MQTLPPAWQPPDRGVSALPVSAMDGRGLATTSPPGDRAWRLSASDQLRDTPAVTNTRHAQVVSCQKARARAAPRRPLARGAGGEFVAAGLAEARVRIVSRKWLEPGRRMTTLDAIFQAASALESKLVGNTK